MLINLDRRPDRLESVSQRCRAIGLEFERFPACDGKLENISILSAEATGQQEEYWNLAAAGLNVTLRRIFEQAKQQQLRSILILEDDVVFHPRINQVLARWMKDIPPDWETIFFGASHVKPFTPLTNSVVQLNGSLCTHCHAVKHTVFDLMLELLHNTLRDPLDVLYATHVHTRGKSYGFSPNLAYQAADYSDIRNKRIENNYLRI
ncbi:MAG: glycosyltransferase family 25 protein [Cytophagales bacterium]|nr:glycosyltransferase family 25 protein [Cytophagales bacterium]